MKQFITIHGFNFYVLKSMYFLSQILSILSVDTGTFELRNDIKMAATVNLIMDTTWYHLVKE